MSIRGQCQWLAGKVGDKHDQIRHSLPDHVRAFDSVASAAVFVFELARPRARCETILCNQQSLNLPFRGDTYRSCFIQGQPIQGQGKHHDAAAWLGRSRSCSFEPYLGIQDCYTLLFWKSTSGKLVTPVTNTMGTLKHETEAFLIPHPHTVDTVGERLASYGTYSERLHPSAQDCVTVRVPISLAEMFDL